MQAVPRPASKAILAALLALQVLIGTYGIDQPLRWGHQGFHVAEHGLGARNLRRHGSLGFTTHHDRGAPSAESQSFHHPSMLQVPVALVQVVFGEAPWTARVVGLAFSVFALLGLWAFCRSTRGELHAAIAAAVFVLHPIHVAFTNLPDVEIMGIGWALWAAFAWSRFVAAPGIGRALPFVVCVAMASLSDWPFYPIALVWLGAEAFAARRGGETRRVTLVALGTASAAVAVVFVQHFVRAWSAGKLDELLTAYEGRTSSASLAAIGERLVSHQGAILLALGCVWLVTRRRPWDLGRRWVLAVLVGQTVYLWRFPNEFMFHEYRGYWYVAPLAIAAADVLAGLTAQSRGLALAAALLVLGWLGASAPAMARLSRARAGSTSMAVYEPRTALFTAARALRALAPRGTAVVVGPGVQDRLEVFWLLDRPARRITSGAEIPGPCFVLEKAVVLGRYAAWRSRVRGAAILLLEDWAIVDLRGVRPPSVEHARLGAGRRYGPLLRWLRAPEEAAVGIRAGEPERAAALAEAIGADEAVIRAARRGDAPLRRLLPPDLAADVSGLATTARHPG